MRKKKDAEQVAELQEPVTESNKATMDVPAEITKIKEFLLTVLQKMGIENCEVIDETVDETITLTINTPDANSVIGYHGEVLDALQYLCGLQLNNKNDGIRRVVLDAEGYRGRREKALRKLAGNLELKVKRTGRPAKLEPMNPYERRIIHTALQNSDYVVTASEGEGSGRRVVISPKGKEEILNAPNAPRKTLNFVYRSDKKRR
ncbi:MAG: KH domain-containing protein [Corallococcus sp.]|nr:KH domain-containing protein [Corallococcus sp.]MCM1359967.1 KH domain-containing protein [Corallococcus sp.]MCM1395523.1 KH domain-containing protein [Corallococcus sp.]